MPIARSDPPTYVVRMTADERNWLASAAERASSDSIASGLGSADALRALARKVLEAPTEAADAP